MEKAVSVGSALLAMLAAACTFDPSTLSSGAANDDEAVDAGNSTRHDASAAGADADPSVDDLLPETPDDSSKSFCEAGGAAVVACYEFEDGPGATILADHSMYGNDAIVSGASFVPGVSGSALQVSSGFDSYVASTSSLNGTAALTIETWLQLDSTVSSGRQGLFDYQGHYGFFVVTQNGLRCSAAGHAAQSLNDIINPGQWHHVACVYDGSTLKVYRDGVEVASTPGSGAISISDNTGAGLAENSPSGDELIGKLDSLRIWSTARSQKELCDGAAISCP